jgi:AhpD family alkylhydroperoxidase
MKSLHEKVFEELGAHIPEVIGGLAALRDAATKDSLLDAKTKRLMIIAVSVAIHCEPCIRSHVRAALDMGISPEEIFEAAGVAILMGGGPAAASAAVHLMDELDKG